MRVLKNFSSLKAIISALQCNPIYRLKHIWVNVPKDKVRCVFFLSFPTVAKCRWNVSLNDVLLFFPTQVEVYEELARIFSEENNQSAQRELLMKEGTAKVIGHEEEFTPFIADGERNVMTRLSPHNAVHN